MKVGDARRRDCHRPLIDMKAVEKVESHIATRSRKAPGCRRRQRSGARRRFFEPTVLATSPPEMII